MRLSFRAVNLEAIPESGSDPTLKGGASMPPPSGGGAGEAFEMSSRRQGVKTLWIPLGEFRDDD